MTDDLFIQSIFSIFPTLSDIFGIDNAILLIYFLNKKRKGTID